MSEMGEQADTTHVSTDRLQPYLFPGRVREDGNISHRREQKPRTHKLLLAASIFVQDESVESGRNSKIVIYCEITPSVSQPS
jgi:hypothetical protein